MSGRDDVIKHLREIADYFLECRSNTSFASKEEKHLWEFQNAAIEASDLLKEQEDALEQMRLDNTDLRNCNAELMKAQEAKQAIEQTYHVMMNRDYENPVEVTRYDWLCPTCKSLLCRDIDVIDDNYHFCKVCGQAVNWE